MPLSAPSTPPTTAASAATSSTGTSSTATTAPTAAACRPASLATDLRLALTHTVRRLRMERSSEGITDGQYAVLAALANNGPMTPTALAEEQNVQPPPMTRTVNALTEAGLVTREEHPTDRRQVLVSVTPAGSAEIKETRRRRTEWLATRLAELTPEERADLARAAVLLRRIAAK